MKDFDPINSWNTETALHYDDQPRGDEEAAALFLADYAKNSKALEFAIGTGRVALPLRQKGVEVDGIEASPAMIKQLRSKPLSETINIIEGDMSLVSTGRQYTLVYLIYNTIFNLLTADDQIRCFENAASHLTGRGVFIVETAIPHTWMKSGQSDYVKAEHIGLSEVALDVARYDPVTQLMEENHVRISKDGITTAPIVCRLITPGEMDLMARIAGLTLIDRFANWQRSPFDASSTYHVSVYGLNPAPGES